MATLRSMRYTVAALAAAFACTCADAAGFQREYVSDPDGAPLAIAVWYPSRATPGTLTIGPTVMRVAVDGPMDGSSLPLIVFSHGTGGSMLGHQDTAIALADAGYVVAAVTHRGDNYADQRRSADVLDRPKQIGRVIDHLLSTWHGHAAIDRSRIGMFGFSAGGFTTLAVIGGIPDLTTVEPMCRDHPDDFACQVLARSGGAPALAATSDGLKDDRVRAAVVAAPAIGYAFAPDGLRRVAVPVQLWRAEDDRILPHPRYVEPVRLALPAAEYHAVPNAGHFDFLAPCSDAFAAIAADLCASAPGFDRVAFHETFNRAVVGFFDRTLSRRSTSAERGVR